MKKLLTLLLIALLPIVSYGAVTFANNGSASGASVSSVTITSFTVGSTANNILCVAVGQRAGGGQTISSVTANGDSLTQAVYINDNGGLRNVAGGVWCRPNADVGTYDIIVTGSGSMSGLFAQASLFYGASATIGATNTSNSISTSKSVSVTTTQTGSYLFGGIVKSDGTVSEIPTDNGGQTQIGNALVGTSPNISTSKGDYKSVPTISTDSIGWTWTTIADNSAYVVEIKEYSAPVSSGSSMLLGMGF